MSSETEVKNIQNFKVVLMGDSGVGKTSIVNRYTKHKFENNLLSTSGICFFSKLLDFPEIKESCKLDVIIIFLIMKIKLQIWDTAGQERFKAITKIYYQKSDAIIFVYDITNLESFKSLKNLYNEVKQSIDLNKVLIFVIGNKNDLYEIEEIKKDEAENFAKSINASYRCVSALKDSGINELFDFVGRSFFNKGEKDDGENNSKDKDESKKPFNINLEGKRGKKGKRKCC